MIISAEHSGFTAQSKNSNIFYTAQDVKTIVKVTCSIKLHGAIRDVLCHGYLSETIGREAKLKVVDQTIIERPCKIYPNEFEYFFCLNKNYPQRMRLGYMGCGKILGVKKNADHSIQALLLRFAAQNVVRRMRRDRRIDWYPEYSKASGVMRIDQIPATRHDLRELIQNHYHLAALRSQIINISAAGACALLPDAPELKSLSADHGLMLYIISDGINLADATYVFLCKKIGITSSDAVDTLKLRMQFTHELNLRNSNSSLSWSEIANTGSSRLNRFIQDICCDEKESSYPEQI
ncbi:hypothetical protein [uncultured Desulfovibrio sp.]|mgnify:FL=1|uniref:hypothetical protein n=1 Tax=uncultured Desulfovibrio sp. TaxID=167968 RepID=UPI0028689D3C|nr:hypothetical protein [uncultured Desulfovibrio sp.]